MNYADVIFKVNLVKLANNEKIDCIIYQRAPKFYHQSKDT